MPIKRREVDWEAAAQVIKPLGRFVFLELDGEQFESQNSLIISDDAMAQTMPYSGTVIASGVPEFQPGDHVLSYLMHGQKIYFDYTAGPYRAGHQVRVIGLARLGEGVTEIDPLEVIVGHLSEDMEIRPTGEWVLIERDAPVSQTAGGILMPDSMVTGTNKGRVLAVGSQAVGRVQVGDRVQYEGRAINTQIAKILGGPYEGRDVIAIMARHIYARLEGAA